MLKKFNPNENFKIIDSKLAYDFDNFDNDVSPGIVELYLVNQNDNLFIIESKEDSIITIAITSKKCWDDNYVFSTEEELKTKFNETWNEKTYVTNEFYVGLIEDMETL